MKFRVTGVGSTFPAASLALTVKECAPSASAFTYGEAQSMKLGCTAFSYLHSKVVIAGSPTAEKVKEGLVVVTVEASEGPVSICVLGAVPSFFTIASAP